MKPIHIIPVAILLALSSCEERINISTDDSAPGLVIYGYIATDSASHPIRITRSAGYFAETPPQGVSGAEAVIVSSGGERYQLTESAGEPGLYLTEPGVCGKVGETYTLRVSVNVDGNGPEHFEASSTLPPAPTIDSIGFAPFTAHDRILQVLLWGRTPQTSHVNYFSSHLYLNGALYNDSLGGFRISNDQFLVSNEIKAVPLFFLNQERNRSRLSPGDTVTVRLEGIPADYADFLTNAGNELRGSNPIFDGPPANVPSNVRSLSEGSETLVLGFFAAYSTTALSAVYENPAAGGSF
ncbi:MAG: DUF4249 domain-containing protein [Tannerellaceae bacterium]|jgi:hypothetical protein|nr:DUF4249 domain-containing protein [Tannerellaceae bacterium]